MGLNYKHLAEQAESMSVQIIEGRDDRSIFNEARMLDLLRDFQICCVNHLRAEEEREARQEQP